MNNSYPQQCAAISERQTAEVRNLVFGDRFIIERTQCGINILIKERFYDAEIKQRYPNDTKELIRFYELRDCDFLDPPVRLVFSQIKTSLDNGTISEMYYEGKVLELLFLVNKSPLTQHSSLLSTDDMSAVSAAREIIDTRFSSCPKIAELAKMTNTSSAKLQKDFKTAFGRTIHDYLWDTRLSVAKEKLEQSNETLRDIAISIGCLKPERFSERFKAVYGLTPAEYRKQLKIAKKM